MTISTEDCAQVILDVTPLIMRIIRLQMRSNRSPDLTVPQFRTLIFIRNHPHASLTDVADHLGLTLSSTSKMVDGLVKRLLVERSDSPQDRRRMTLKLTGQGNASLDQAIQCTLNRVSSALVQISETERAGIVKTMQLLNQVFAVELSDPSK
jgi:DNA-binding MarR family transcriptional regulator